MRIKRVWQTSIWIGLLLLLIACEETPTALPSTPSTTPETPTQSTLIQMTPQVTHVHVGEPFTLAVTVANAQDVSGAEVHLTYDANLLTMRDDDPHQEGVQATHGDFLFPDFVATHTLKTPGAFTYAIMQMPPHDPRTGDGTLMQLTFVAQTAGNSQIDLPTVLLADSAGNAIPVTLQGAQISVVE